MPSFLFWHKRSPPSQKYFNTFVCICKFMSCVCHSLKNRILVLTRFWVPDPSILSFALGLISKYILLIRCRIQKSSLIFEFYTKYLYLYVLVLSRARIKICKNEKKIHPECAKVFINLHYFFNFSTLCGMQHLQEF